MFVHAMQPLALSSFKSLDKTRMKLRNSIKAQDNSIWRSVDKATLTDDNEVQPTALPTCLHFLHKCKPGECLSLQAFANLFLSALSKVETAKRLCKYEDDRLFAALSIKEIVAVLQGQPVCHCSSAACTSSTADCLSALHIIVFSASPLS